MPAGPIERAGTRLAYGLAQAPRVAFYLGQGYAMRRLGKRYAAETPPETAETPPPGPDTDAEPQPAPAPTLSRNRLYADLARLFARDLANVEAGLYPVPAGEDGGLIRRLRTSRLFFDDLPAIAKRRRTRDGQEVAASGLGENLPRYYRQNFHFQTDGWLSENSAKIYDAQVETLFAGAANAMRRQSLPLIADWMKGRDQRDCRLLDLACGTGCYLREVKRAFPALPVVALDLSEAYLGAARGMLHGRARTGFVNAKAEALPFADQSLDLVTSVFLFHELPPKIRREVAHEIARVLKPDGLFVMVDSLQHGDVPDYDPLLARFPHGFHEPYYASYIDEDLSALFGAAGLPLKETSVAWLSKVASFARA